MVPELVEFRKTTSLLAFKESYVILQGIFLFFLAKKEYEKEHQLLFLSNYVRFRFAEIKDSLNYGLSGLWHSVQWWKKAGA